jgi:hypothetical protein
VDEEGVEGQADGEIEDEKEGNASTNADDVLQVCCTHLNRGLFLPFWMLLKGLEYLGRYGD